MKVKVTYTYDTETGQLIWADSPGIAEVKNANGGKWRVAGWASIGQLDRAEFTYYPTDMSQLAAIALRAAAELKGTGKAGYATGEVENQ